MTLYVTPDTTTPTLVGVVLHLPDDVFLRAAFLGAVETLARAENWQQVGTMTPEDAARLFEEAIALSWPLVDA